MITEAAMLRRNLHAISWPGTRRVSRERRVISHDDFHNGASEATRPGDLLSLAYARKQYLSNGNRWPSARFISMPAMTADDDFDSQTRLPITRGWYPLGS